MRERRWERALEYGVCVRVRVRGCFFEGDWPGSSTFFIPIVFIAIVFIADILVDVGASSSRVV